MMASTARTLTSGPVFMMRIRPFIALETRLGRPIFLSEQRMRIWMRTRRTMRRMAQTRGRPNHVGVLTLIRAACRGSDTPLPHATECDAVPRAVVLLEWRFVANLAHLGCMASQVTPLPRPRAPAPYPGRRSRGCRRARQASARPQQSAVRWQLSAAMKTSCPSSPSRTRCSWTWFFLSHAADAVPCECPPSAVAPSTLRSSWRA